MHIALIAEDLPLPEYGGAGILLGGIVHHLRQAGHRTTLVWLPSVYRRDVTERQRQGLAALGVGLITLEFPQGPAPRRSLSDTLRYAFRPSVSDFYPVVALGPEVDRQINRVEPDAILAFDVPAVAASRGITQVPRLAAVGTWAHRFRYHRWRTTPFQWTLSYLKYSVWVFTSLLQAKRMIALMAECQASGHFAANFARWLKRHGVGACQYYRTCLVDPVGEQWPHLRAQASVGKTVPKIVMVGAVGTPTYVGLRVLAKEILPGLEQRLGRQAFEVHLIGKITLPPELASLVSHPSVRLRGFVEDLDQELFSADLLLVPTPVKLSIRTRIITGLAYGCCVVTTRADAAAIPELVHLQNALIAKNGAQLVELIIQALKDAPLRARIGVGARQTFERYFASHVAGKALEEELSRIVAEFPAKATSWRPRRTGGVQAVAGFLRLLGRALETTREAGRALGVAAWCSPAVRGSLNNFLAGIAIKRQILARVNDHAVMLADFPRCGIGWIRFVVATVLQYHRTGQFRKLTTQEEMYVYTPTVTGSEREFRPFVFNGGRYLLKTHTPYDPRFTRAIVLYRNPYEAIRSAYAHDLMDGVGNLYPRIKRLTAEESYVIHRAREYVRFHESWLSPIRTRPDRYLVIKYEEMLTVTEPVLARIFEFLRIDITDLPPEGLAQLATMYSRTDCSPPWPGKADREEAVRRKSQMGARIQPITTAECLRRIDPDLEARLRDIVAQMDAVRWRAPSRAELELSHA